MMVKDEEKNLERCLESLRPVMDGLDAELIVVDTGSSDNTVAIAEKYTEKVYLHRWNNNFSEMRNISIAYAEGEWIWIIDGDEEIQNPEVMIELFKKDLSRYNTITVRIKNYMTSSKDGREADFNISVMKRGFRRTPDFKFEGVVHNQPLSKPPVYNSDVVFGHYGYIFEDKEFAKKKFDRTTGILKQELAKNPNNIYYQFQLAVSWSNMDLSRALIEMRKAFELINKQPGNIKARYLYAYGIYARITYKNKEHYETIRVCDEGLAFCGDYPDLLYLAGATCAVTNQHEKAFEYFDKYIKLMERFYETPISRDSAFTFYHLDENSKQIAVYNICLHYCRKEQFDPAEEYCKKLENDDLKLIAGIKLAIGRKSYDKLPEHYRGINGNHNLVNMFAGILEKERVDENERMEIYKAMAQIEINPDDNAYSAYPVLNRIRLALADGSAVSGPVNDLIYSINYSKLQDFYGDVVYFLIKNGLPLPGLDSFGNQSVLTRCLKYLDNKYLDFGSVIFDYVKAQPDKDGSDEPKKDLVLLRFALLRGNPDDVQYMSIFSKYLSKGIYSLKNIYHPGVLEQERTADLKNDEEAFFLYMLKAFNYKDSEPALYIQYLRKALNSYPMKRGIELLLKEAAEKVKSGKSAGSDFEAYREQVLSNIKSLVDSGNIAEAEELLGEYEKICGNDINACSIKTVIYLLKNEWDNAEKAVKAGLDVEPENFDLLYNAAYLYSATERPELSFEYYQRALKSCTEEQAQLEIKEALQALKEKHPELAGKLKQKTKLVFFLKTGMNSFVDDIVEEMSKEYDARFIKVSDYKQIDKWMEWADICWFEWCDELIIYGSQLKLAQQKRIICRLHSYEAFTDYISKVKWENVDKVIFVAEHIRDFVVEQVKGLDKEKTVVIPNGIDIDRYSFKERKPGFNIAYVGYINYKKGPMLLLHTFKAIHDRDSRYKLYIAGKYQDWRYFLYFRQMLKEMQLENNVFFDGWQDNISEWLEDKSYIISTSVLEGNPVGIMEAMSRGIKPIIHNFVGCEKQFDKYSWNTIGECLDMLLTNEYNSKEYREFIEKGFSLEKQIKSVKCVLEKVADNVNISNMGAENKEIRFGCGRIENLPTDSDVKDFYDNFLGYLENDRKRENPRHNYLKNRLKQIIKSGDKVLDLGCGIGITTEYINTLGVNKVIGVDLSEKLISYARSTVQNVEFIAHDITELNLGEKFDVISLCDVMEHVPREKYIKLFKVIKNHLKENGIVFLSIPDPEYLNMIRDIMPEKLQIIDNSITYGEMSTYCEKYELFIRFFNAYGVSIEKEYNEYILQTNYVCREKWKNFLQK